MSDKKRKLICYRCEDENGQGLFSVFEIPYDPDMTVMTMLDIVTKEIDTTFAHLTHSRCDQGYCGRCAMRINGKSCLACLEITSEEVVIVEPLNKKKLTKDMVSKP